MPLPTLDPPSTPQRARLLRSPAPRPPLPEREQERLCALRRYAVLDSEAERDFDLLATVAAELTGSPRAFINLVDADRVWAKSAVGRERSEWPRESDYCAWSVAEPRGLHIRDLREDPRTTALPGTVGPTGYRMYAGANLVTPDGHCIGTLCVLDVVPRRLAPRQLELLDRLAAQVMALLELRHSQQELRRAQSKLLELATHDALTGLSNRLAWNSVLEHETGRHARYKGAFSILVIDLDHFKRINDRHGHPAGDEVLRAAAALMREQFRCSDTVARLGGEEFGVLLPETRLADARLLATRFRRRLAAMPLDAVAPGLRVTASVGVASSGDARAAAAIMAAADRRAYIAKRLGRNRVVAADSHPIVNSQPPP